MESSYIGAHCAFGGCNQQDFLPFRCPSCARDFCLDHRTNSSHQCTAAASDAIGDDEQHPPAAVRCAAACSILGCHTVGPPVSCADCGATFCVLHRDARDHACSASLGSIKAHHVLRSSLQPSLVKRLGGATLSTNSKQRDLARKVQLMRVTGRSKVDAAIPLGNRFFLEAFYSDDTNAAPAEVSVYLCVDRQKTVGKVLDTVARELRIGNVNDSATLDSGQRLHLGSLVADPLTAAAPQLIALETRRTLSSYETEGVVVSGGTLVLQRG